MDLIPKANWISRIESIKETKIKPSKKQLKGSIIESIKKQAKDDNAVLFSGGIDSTLIAFILKKLNKDFTCYSIGIENSKDLKAAEEIATTLGFKLKSKIVSLDEVEIYLKKTIKILKERDTVKLSIGTVVHIAADLAKQDNQSNLFSGLGAEELFVGYKRYRTSENPEKECWNGLKTTWKRDLSRDIPIANNLNVIINAPLLDEEVIKQSMAFPIKEKFDIERDKIILRELAIDLGIPIEFANRKKIAAQYGSGIDKAITKLAKRNGFKLKRDYLNQL